MPKQTSEFGRNWYAVHTYSGYEDAVARNLKQRIESMDMEDKIFNILIPTEKKIKIKAKIGKMNLTGIIFFNFLTLEKYKIGHKKTTVAAREFGSPNVEYNR